MARYRQQWMAITFTTLAVVGQPGCGSSEPPLAVTTEDLVEAQKRRAATLLIDGLGRKSGMRPIARASR